MRIGITGGPKTGKTTLAKKLEEQFAVTVFHTDDVKHLPWDQQPAEIVRRAPRQGIIEGVQVARAARKGLTLDWLLVLDQPLEQLTRDQKAMAKGLETILQGVRCPVVRCHDAEEAIFFLESLA
jgi:hypothetical protein